MDTYNRAGCPRGERGGGMPNFNRVSLYSVCRAKRGASFI